MQRKDNIIASNKLQDNVFLMLVIIISDIL